MGPRREGEADPGGGASEVSGFRAGCRPGQSSLLPLHDRLHTFQVPTCFSEREKCGLGVQVAKDGGVEQAYPCIPFLKIGCCVVIVVFFTVNTRKS